MIDTANIIRAARINVAIANTLDSLTSTAQEAATVGEHHTYGFAMKLAGYAAGLLDNHDDAPRTSERMVGIAEDYASADWSRDGLADELFDACNTFALTIRTIG